MADQDYLRSHDVVILLKIITLDTRDWAFQDLSKSLFIEPEDISASLACSHYARLINHSKTRVNRQSFMEFLRFGLKYAFPQHPGDIIPGMPTAHAHPYMKKYIISDIPYVWPNKEGSEIGRAIQPLYERQTVAAKKDEQLYLLLSLVDVLRVGRIREQNIAIKRLSEIVDFRS